MSSSWGGALRTTSLAALRARPAVVAAAAVLALFARLVELRRVVVLLLARRRVRGVRDRRRGRLDRRLDHRLLASFLRHALLVGARHLDLLVGRAAARGAAGARRAAAAARRT